MRLPAQLREHKASWSRAWGGSWNLHAVLSSCSETAGLLQSSSLLGVHILTQLLLRLQWPLCPGSCTGALGRYQNILLPTQRLVQMSSVKSFSDKDLLVVTALSTLLLARIRGDLCSALTLEPLSRALWIRCQIRREPALQGMEHSQMSRVQPLHSSSALGQRGRHWGHYSAPRITSHWKGLSCKGGKTVTV